MRGIRWLGLFATFLTVSAAACTPAVAQQSRPNIVVVAGDDTIVAIAAGRQLLRLVADGVPRFNVEATCRKSVEADREMGLDLPQSFNKCMSDENSAQQQLGPIWSSYSPTIRAQCEGEATAAGDVSYVDLLTCLQMTDGSVTASASALKGASRKKKAPN
jgi:hypothetical protein